MQEDDVRLLGFTSEVLRALRRPEPLCTQRDANAATPNTIAECTGSLANSDAGSSPWQQLHDLAVEQQSYVERMALMVSGKLFHLLEQLITSNHE